MAGSVRSVVGGENFFSDLRSDDSYILAYLKGEGFTVPRMPVLFIRLCKLFGTGRVFHCL